MHAPIIDISLFNTCQQIRKKYIHKSCKYDDIFKGLIFCGNCGKTSTLKHKTKINKNNSISQIDYYLCSEANKGTKKKCDNTKSISAKKLYELICPILIKECRNIFINKNDISILINNINNKISYNTTILKKEYNQINARIAKLNNQIKQIYEDKLERKITDELFTEIQNKKQEELLKCQRQLKDIEKNIEQETKRNTISYDQVQQIVQKFLNTNTISKELLHTLVNRIEFDNKKNLKIYFSFSDMLKRN